MIIYIRETEKVNDIIKKVLLKLKKSLNIIKVQDNGNNKMYYLPIFKGENISKYRVKRLARRVNLLLEKDGASTVVLSGYLNSNALFKNYLYSNNINILNGRFLFKCLTYRAIEYIFKTKSKEMELRRSFITN